jgi:hypothetical protein
MRAQPGRGEASVDSRKQLPPIGADLLRQCLSLRRLFGQPVFLDPALVALMPLRWHLAAQPVGCHNRQVIEGCSQPFSRTLQSIDGANGLQHMRRGGALLASRVCRQPRARHCSSRAESNRSPWSLSNRRVRNSLNTEKSKPGPVSSKRRHVLPVDARADRFGRLSIRVVFHELHHRHQC